MSAISTAPLFSFCQSESKLIAQKKRSFDDLLLPSFNMNSGALPTTDDAPYSLRTNKRCKTAPPSPVEWTQISPLTSPVTSSYCTPQNKSLNFKSPALVTKSPEVLPPLRHLKLLPNPHVQEYSYKYPDTCVNTSLWKQNLVTWCKQSDYTQYQNILSEVSYYAPKSRNHTHGLNVLAEAAKISSIVSSPDEFYELSNSSNAKTVIVTPPTSPGKVFTSMLSRTMVEAVKQKRVTKHKKSNSFKARKLKKMLDNRIPLTHEQQFESQKTVFRANIGPTTPPASKADLSICPDSVQSSPTFVPVLSNNKVIADKIEVSEDETDQDTNHLSSPKGSPQRRNSQRYCVSCHCTDSPCWRPSWSGNKQHQLCNSCGLRYKKTRTRCTNSQCRKIPSKGEVALMKSNGLATFTKPDGSKVYGMACLFCAHMVIND